MAVILDIDHEAGDLSEWVGVSDPGGDLSASSSAALAGSGYGLACRINDTQSFYALATVSPDNTSGVFRIRLYFDPNSLTMAHETNHFLATLRSNTNIATLKMEWTTTGGFAIQAQLVGDSSTLSTAYHAITDEPHYIEIRLVRATNSSSADGTLDLWIDGVHKEQLVADNYDMFSYFRQLRLGNTSGVDSTTSGTYYFDEIVINDDGSEIGPVGGSGITADVNVTGADGTVSASATVVANTSYDVTESNIFFSPGNWVKNGTSWAQTVNPGAYMKFKFNGTGLSVAVDVSVLRAAGITSGNFPKVAYRVDGGSFSSEQLSNASDTLTVTVASGLSAGEHTAEFYLAGVGGNDRWSTPTNHLRVTGVTVTSGTLSAPTLRSKRWLIFGDSISYGVNALGTTESYSVANKDATKAWGILLAEALDAEVGIVGFVGQGWDAGGGGSTGVPEFHVAGGNNTWDEIYSGQARSFAGIDRVFVNHGTNDGDSASVIEADVEDFLADFRAANPDTWLVIVLPFDHSNSNKTPITDGFNDYQSSTGDGRVVLIEANPAADVCQEMDGETYPNGVTYTSDSIHPNAAGNIALADLLEADFGSALGYVSATGADGTVSASGSVGSSEVTASASITGADGTVSAQADVTVQAQAGLTGQDGSVSAQADALVLADVNLTGQDGEISSQADVLIQISSGVTGEDGALEFISGVLVSAQASITGEDGSVDSIAGSFSFGDADLTGESGTVSAQAGVTVSGSAGLTGQDGSVDSQAGVTVQAQASLTGADGTVSASIGAIAIATLSLTGQDGSVAGSAEVTVAASADLTGEDGAVDSQAAVSLAGSASLTGQDGSVDSSAGVLVLADVSLTGEDGSVSATIGAIAIATLSLTGQDGSVESLAGVTVSGSASLTGQDGSVSGSAGVGVLADVILVGADGSLSAEADAVAGGSVSVLGEDGSVVSVAGVTVSAVVTITGADGSVVSLVGVRFSVDLMSVSEINRVMMASSEIDPTDSVMMASSEINRSVFADGSVD